MTVQYPAEWHAQSFVQLTWPHHNTDWKNYLDEAEKCFSELATALAKYTTVLIVKNENIVLPKKLKDYKNIYYHTIATDDTWARDHGGISVIVDGKVKILDFTFNGWGNKYEWKQDNAITKQLVKQNVITAPLDTIDFVLEGGSLESNGGGILLTTEQCLLNPNRNSTYSKEQIELMLKQKLGIEKILWLKHGYLAGDDTDSHIDTLARFVDSDTIMYVQCTDVNDEHFEELQLMEKELQNFTDSAGEHFNLIPLPMAEAVFFEGERLPATYANFLITNNAVFVPIYNIDTDNSAIKIFENFFKNRDIIPINCSVLIKQHGSLHCVTMQYIEEISLKHAN